MSGLSTTTPTPTFVLIPGHWHTLSHLTPLISTLTSRGHLTTATQLHSVGLKPTRPTFSDDVCVIYAAVTRTLIAGSDVCLVLHSYAGMPGAEAVNRLISDGALEPCEGRGRVVKIVFIAAYTFPAGFVMDARAMMGPDNPGFTISPTPSSGGIEMTHMASPWHYFFNDLPLSAAKPFVDTLGPTYYLGTGPKISSDKWRKAPITALLCKRDNAVPGKKQEQIWKGMESEWIDAGHSPYVSRPEEVADILVRLVGGS